MSPSRTDLVTSDEKQTNAYSREWFEFFHADIAEARTLREIDFILRFAPQPEYQKILDVCCGMGRHARALSERGYAITGIDRDKSAIEKARQSGGGASYIVADIRNYRIASPFDAVIIMGQSFGHFDTPTNLEVLQRLAHGVRKCGRIILDLWNPEFFLAHPGERELATSKGIVREFKRVDGDRLFVELTFPSGARECFEWQLFTPEQIDGLAKASGLSVVAACGGFDAESLPSPDDPRIEFVLER